ncbi:MAG: hypothetical protein M3Q99_14735 [Acidobacteriota bacterium]|nr:hypothetical protein [Acidobacteriota bacterium]
MNSEQDTFPNNQTILDAVNNLQAFVVAKFDEVDRNFSEVNKRFQVMENRLEDMRLEMMSFDVRIDRLQAMSHENLNIAYGVRADVKVLREEVSAWSKEVIELQLKAA